MYPNEPIGKERNNAQQDPCTRVQKENRGLTKKADSGADRFGGLSHGAYESGKEKPQPASAKGGNDKPGHKAECNGESDMAINKR